MGIYIYITSSNFFCTGNIYKKKKISFASFRLESRNIFPICRNRNPEKFEIKLYRSSSSSASIRLQQPFKDDDGALFFFIIIVRFFFLPPLRTHTRNDGEFRRHHLVSSCILLPIFRFCSFGSVAFTRDSLRIVNGNRLFRISMIHRYRCGWLVNICCVSVCCIRSNHKNSVQQR